MADKKTRRASSPRRVARVREREPGGIEQFDELRSVDRTAPKTAEKPQPAASSARERPTRRAGRTRETSDVKERTARRLDGLNEEDFVALEKDQASYQAARRAAKTRGKTLLFE